MNEKIFEPALTGFSYSFTDDGHYEEAYYRAVSNRVFLIAEPSSLMQGLIYLLATNPTCPQGIVQWQHGKYAKNANGSLTLTPFEVDGRQLLSDPCNNANGVFTRYHQVELFKVQSTSWSLIKEERSRSCHDRITRLSWMITVKLSASISSHSMAPLLTLCTWRTSRPKCYRLRS